MFGLYRFFLSMLVVVHHTGASPLMFSGVYAVEGFFILSGFLMAFSFTRNYAEGALGGVRFYANRFLRLYPMYWVVTFLFLLALGVFKLPLWNQLSERGVALSFVMILQNYWIYLFNRYAPDTAIWSLAVEFQFYLLIPILISFFFRRIGFIIALSLAYCMLGQLFRMGTFSSSVYPFIGSQLFVFLLGANLWLGGSPFFDAASRTLANMWDRFVNSGAALGFALIFIFLGIASLHPLLLPKRTLLNLVVFFALFGGLALFKGRINGAYQRAHADILLIYAVVSIASYALLANVFDTGFESMCLAAFILGILVNVYCVIRLKDLVLPDGSRARKLDNLLGDYSYELFLVHGPVLYLLEQANVSFLGNPFTMTAVVMVASMTASLALQYLVKKPVERIRNTIRHGKSALEKRA